MTTAIELDPVLASLNDELRAQMSALNQLHHPVTPSDPRRIRELESRITALRSDISARKRELSP